MFLVRDNNQRLPGPESFPETRTHLILAKKKSRVGRGHGPIRPRLESVTVGSLNAVGPKSTLAVGRMLEVIKKTTNSDARFIWVDDKFLANEKIIDDIPIWTSPHRPEIGYSTMNINKAVSKGLTFRPLADSTRATLVWFRKQSTSRQLKMRAGIKTEREAEVLAACHASKK